MKTRLLAFSLLAIAFQTAAQNVGIGNASFTPDASSILELRSTDGGFLMPRMTEAQRDAISSPASGLMIYQTNNTPGYYYYDGSSWQSFGASIDNLGDHTATQNLVVGAGLGLTDTDSDTKIQLEESSDEDQIRFDIAGLEAMMINSSRNVGIGTGLPTERLHVNGNIRIADGGYIEDDGFAGGNNDDWLRLNGFVEVKSNTDNQGLVVRDKDNNQYVAITQKNGWSYFSDNNTSSNYFLRGNGSNVDVKGDIRVLGSDVYDNSGNLRLSGEDNVFITMDYNNNDNNNRSIRFGKNNMGSPTELMRIDEDGNVGIGEINPTSMLQVAGRTATESLRVTNGAANGLVLTSDASGNATWQPVESDLMDNDGDTQVQVEESTDEDRIRFDVSGVQAMLIDNNGNVGVGTNSPDGTLTVGGTNSDSEPILSLQSGNNNFGTNDGAQIAFGFNGTNQYQHFIQTRHSSGTASNNAIDFYTSNGTANNSLTSGANHVMSLNGTNVGIGTTAPERALHVKSSASNQNVVTVQSTATNGWSSVDFHDQSGSLSATFGFANSGTSGIFTNRAYMNSYNHDFVLTRNSSENSIFIKGSTGAIGLNTANPTARLDVNGNARVRNLAGSGTRMVVADGLGNLSTQSIPESDPVAVLDAVTTAVNGSSTQQTNSASYSDLAQMSLSIVPGRYIFQFNASMEVNNGNTVGEFAFSVNGSTVSESVRQIKPGTNSPGIASIITVVDVTTAGTLKVRYRRSSGSGKVTVRGRTLMYTKVGS